MTVFENNRALLDSFRVGDAAALAEVYRHYVSGISILVCRGFLAGEALRVQGESNPDNQRELIQEVFVRAFSEKARTAYDGLRPYRPYLFRIAKNMLIDRSRRPAREVPLKVDADAGHNDTAGTNLAEASTMPPEESLDWQRQKEATAEYVAGLGEELRNLIRLRFEEGKSQRDAAQTLGVTRRRVRTLEQRALGGLLNHLITRGLTNQ